MEVDPQQWVPLGVWRFREIAKRALDTGVKKFQSMDEATQEIGKYLRNPLHNWLRKSQLYNDYLNQTKLTDFM